MSNFDLIVRAIHVIGAAIWLGAAFFVGWFLLPALRETGPDGGKVMAAVQKRGWMAVVPIVATLTVLSGIWLYRPYMGDSGNAAMILGIGGVTAIVAYIWGAGITSPSMAKATKLSARLAAMPDGPEKKQTIETVQRLRQRGLIGARAVSILTIISATLMTVAAYL